MAPLRKFTDLICGCGDPSAVLKQTCAFLRVMEEWSREARERNYELRDREADAARAKEIQQKFKDLAGSEESYWLWLYFLTAADLAEHGTSVRWSWPTAEGNQILRRCEGCETDEQWDATYEKLVSEIDYDEPPDSGRRGCASTVRWRTTDPRPVEKSLGIVVVFEPSPGALLATCAVVSPDGKVYAQASPGLLLIDADAGWTNWAWVPAPPKEETDV